MLEPNSLCKLIEIPKIYDARGNLSVIESNRIISFEIKRVYYLYDVPSGSERAGHAHKKLHQLLIPVSGSFSVHIDDGKEKWEYVLNRPNIGLYIPPLYWRVLRNFSSGSVCLAIVSDYFDESEYIRDYDEYIHYLCENKK